MGIQPPSNTIHKHNDILCPYSVLGIRRDATKTEITSAYRRLSLLHHPRRKQRPSSQEQLLEFDDTTTISSFPSVLDEELQEKEWNFLVIGAAYETLMDDTARRRYDALPRDGGRDDAHMSVDIPKGCSLTKIICNTSVKKRQRRICCDGTETMLSSKCLEGWVKCSIKTPRRDRPYDDDSSYDATASIITSSSVTGGDEDPRIHHHHHHSSKHHHPLEDDLFGGPLHWMYRARNHADFTDPYIVFNQVFHSNIFKTSERERAKPNNKKRIIHRVFSSLESSSLKSSSLLDSKSIETNTTWTSRCKFQACHRPTSPIWTGTTLLKTDEGNTISKQSRIVDGRKITRTKILSEDPVTGEKQTRVEVHWEDVSQGVDSLEDSKPMKGGKACAGLCACKKCERGVGNRFGCGFTDIFECFGQKEKKRFSFDCLCPCTS